MSIKQENLIPYEGELKVGQRLVKVGDTFIPVGVGGAFEPGSVNFIEVGSGVYYKCVSVDATNGKWSGYKAIQAEDGSWSFEDVVTSGLSYTDITPIVGEIYSSDASVKIQSFWKGYPTPDLYFPLNSAKEQVSNASLDNYGVSFTNEAANFDGGSFLNFPQSIYSKFNNRSSVMVCLWFRKNTDSVSEWEYFLSTSNNLTNFEFAIHPDNRSVHFASMGAGGSWNSESEIAVDDFSVWNFCVFYTKENGSQFAYINGRSQVNNDCGEFYEVSNEVGNIGRRVPNESNFFSGSMARLSVWFDLDLTQEQFVKYCNKIMNEWQPE